VTVLVHTCGGTATADVAPVPQDDPCGCTRELPADRCCTVVLKAFQLNPDQQASTVIPTIDSPTISVFPFDVLNESPVDRPSVSHLYSNISPPRSTPTTILNCTFLI
jgi:hypothetical protein